MTTELKTLAGPLGTRRTNGDNRLSPEDRAAHNWYRFVLSFPPHLVREYVGRFNIGSKHRVLDPFCGTGTVPVECKKLGIPSVGVEANPMAHFASEVKLDWTPDPDELKKHAATVAKAAIQRLNRQGVQDDPLPLFRRKTTKTPNLRMLLPEVEKLILKDSISPLPLHKTLVLIDCLDKYANESFSRHERLALAKVLVASIGNLHFGPEVGIGKIKEDSPVISVWLNEVNSIANDLRFLKVRKSASTMAIVHHADARELSRLLKPESIDLVFTSPPYPNEKDYSRTTRLESVLLGFTKSKDDLRAFKKQLVRSNTRSVYVDDKDDTFVEKHAEIQRIAQAIEKRRIELGKTSGFERLYPRLTKLYFGGMARHLADLRPVLRPGAYLAYVVGDQASYLRVMIRTGQILASIAEELGYEVVGLDLFRERIATATKEWLREEVVVLRWNG